jgi:hypothetical protein
MVISMIIDLATLTIAFIMMAFTSTTAIAQIAEGQVNLFKSSNCTPDSYFGTMYTNGSLPVALPIAHRDIFAASPESTCNSAACLSSGPQSQPLQPNGNMSIMIFNENVTIEVTTCYFCDTGSKCDQKDPPLDLSVCYAALRPDINPGCQVVPSKIVSGILQPAILIFCSTGECYTSA